LMPIPLYPLPSFSIVSHQASLNLLPRLTYPYPYFFCVVFSLNLSGILYMVSEQLTFWRDNVFGLGVLMEKKGEILSRSTRKRNRQIWCARIRGVSHVTPVTRQGEKRRCNGCRN
jgi:hypothetical protein